MFQDNEERVPDIPDSGLPQGILPKLLASLVDRRRQVKRLLKDPHIAESVRMQVGYFPTMQLYFVI